MSRSRIAEPKLFLLALGAILVMVLGIVAIAETDDVWLVVLCVAAVAAIGAGIAFDLTRVAASGDAPEVIAPKGRAIVLCTEAMTAEQVLEHTGRATSLMIVAPERPDYIHARRVEADTVAALRGAGIRAAGHVGDRNPEHAIEDALALFPAAKVVVIARGAEASVYREHVDFEAIRERTGAEVRVLEILGA
jgi:predicted Fe-Mo cluster-binding NifX family protein